MYIPKEFLETRFEEIVNIIDNYPLACIIANSENGIIATHVPLLMKKNGNLIGHLSSNNDMNCNFTEDQEILVIFKGDDAYVSPYFYTKGCYKNVPTWNYQAIHVYGKLKYFKSTKSKLSIIGKLVKKYENKTNGMSAWKLSDSCPEYIENLLNDFIVFEITPSKLLAKSKLSQDRNEDDFSAVMKALKSQGKYTLVENMSRLDKNNH